MSTAARNPFSSGWVRGGADERLRPQGTLSYVSGGTDDPLRFRTVSQALDKCVGHHGSRDAAIFAADGITLSWYDLQRRSDEVAAALRAELQARFAQAGIVVVDAKLTHLAYAPEIAGTMLRRQQAEAVVAARSKIVQGAVGMVELALKGLAERGLVELDDERKAAMVSNLLVVLCADRDVTPVVNAGTLYN